MASATFEFARGLPVSMFNDNRQRFLKKFKEMVKDIPAGSIMFFKGKEEIPIDSTDCEYLVRQESFFYYLFGVEETGCYACINVDKEEVTLFIEEPNPLHQIAMVIYDKADYQKRYGYHIEYTKDMEGYIEKLAPKKIYLNYGKNIDSGLMTLIPQEPWLSKYTVDKETMHDILCESRVIKSIDEIKIMRIASQAAAEGHVEVMKSCKPGLMESYLVSKMQAQGRENYNVQFRPYGDIMASGANSGILHYVNNDKIIGENELVLCDCGHKIGGYSSDITTTFPSNGKFTKEQKTIYEIVLKMNRTIESRLKAGVNWRDMHLLAEKILLTELKNLGILKGDVKEMQEKRLSYLFMPHGLGHLIGLDTHDVGGYTKFTPEKIMKPGLKNLRSARNLEAGSVVTVEPGCYFIEFLLTKGAEMVGIPTSYIDFEKIKPYIGMGGVRIEDDLVITQTGVENMTKDLPRTVEQIEACMAGKDWRSITEVPVISDVI